MSRRNEPPPHTCDQNGHRVDDTDWRTMDRYTAYHCSVCGRETNRVKR